MPPSLAYYFDSGALVGTRQVFKPSEADPGWKDTPWFWPDTAYFCPDCGEIWGRMVYERKPPAISPTNTIWSVESRRCPKHRGGFFLAGCRDHHLESCSRELLAREAFLLCLNRQ